MKYNINKLRKLIRETIEDVTEDLDSEFSSVYTLNWEFVRSTTNIERIAAQRFYDEGILSLGYPKEGTYGYEDDFYGWYENGEIVVIPL